jgi:hypothetical protein
MNPERLERHFGRTGIPAPEGGIMNMSEVIRMRLVVALLEHSKREPNEFVELRKYAVDSSWVRQAIADLRIEGHVEEQMRGVIRLTPLGFEVYSSSQRGQHHPRSC